MTSTLPALPPALAAEVLAARGRPTGRGRPRGPLLHAVPGTDRTRSALCGARVGGATRPWPLAADSVPGTSAARRRDEGTCPECAALLAGAA